MDERHPQRRRKLSPKEIKALEKQRKKQQAIYEKREKQAAKEREAARKQARKNAHINEPRGNERLSQREQEQRRRAEYERRHIANDNNSVRVQSIEVESERPIEPRRVEAVRDNRKRRRPEPKKTAKERRPEAKKRRKTMPDIIEKETDKRVRNLEARDHKDGFYADEVEIRKAQAQKQREKRREKMPKPISPQKRRVRRIIAYVSIITTVIVVGAVLSLTVLFKTENIYVSGNKYYAEDTIIRLAQVREGDNIFMASMFGNSKAVSDSLPYVKSASINFQLPNSIVINIENAKEAQCIKTDGMYFKVSEENILLEQVEKKPKKLTSLIAPTLKSTNIGDKVEFKDKSYTKALNNLTECIQKNNYTKITEINIKSISDISITYDNRIKIKIGLPEAIEYKLKTAFAIINEKLDPNHTGRVKGVLNVSKCNKTKKSYFKEGSLDETEEIVTQPTTAATEETTVRTTFIAAEEETSEAYDYNEDGNSDENYDDNNDEEPYTEAEE
jgi:cell division septal protein FtsQ